MATRSELVRPGGAFFDLTPLLFQKVQIDFQFLFQKKRRLFLVRYWKARENQAVSFLYPRKTWGEGKICPLSGCVLTCVPLGGGRFCSLPDFFDCSKTATDVDAKLSVPCSASLWRLPSKFKKKIRREILEQMAFQWRHVLPFWVKNGKCSKPSGMYRYETKRQRCKIACSTKWLYRILVNIRNWYQIKNDFSKINAHKIKEVFLKTRNICSKAIYDQQVYKIAKQYLYFSQCNDPKIR